MRDITLTFIVYMSYMHSI